MEYGIVYLLTNPVMPALVKIGMTTQEDIDKRMKELYTTGVPVPFECQFACKVKKGDCAKIEKATRSRTLPWCPLFYKGILLSDIYDETYPFEE